MAELDHLLWAAPDLDAGRAEIAASTGVEPAIGGSHPGFGTRNALLSLGASYLEIISPDPAQDLANNRGGRIAALPGSGLLTFAVRTADLAGFADAARRAGLAPADPRPMSRTRPDGLRLDWSVLSVASHAYGDLIPFAIDWKASPHPAWSTPAGCTLVEVAALHPEPAALAALYAALGVAIAVRPAPTPGLIATIETLRGLVRLASAPIGSPHLG